MNADILILGCGIAGLRCGLAFLHKRPSSQVVILEKYNYIGGRITTFHKDIDQGCKHLQWENGAGRISYSHKKVIQLINKYSLTKIPLDNTIMMERDGVLTRNIFNDVIRSLLPELKKLGPEMLAQHTLRELITKILGKEKAEELCIEFPYRAELDTLRADLALESFQGEMGTYDDYFVLKEGYQALPKAMAEEFRSLGGTIMTGQEVVDIQSCGNLLVKTKTEAGEVLWEAPTVISTLHLDAMKEIPALKNIPILKHVKMEPLVRIYAVFPTEDGKSWFSGIPKLASSSMVRFFIPMNPACGTAMISYTDGKDARKVLSILNKKGEKYLEKTLLQELKAMFPTLSIPKPYFFKVHAWTSGCTYWLPGSYDPKEESKKMFNPLENYPGLHCCGESFCLRQAWVEGALEHADQLLARIL